MSVERFAAALIEAAERGRRAAPDWVPETEAEAYAVQAHVAAHFGAVGGWKTGRRPGTPQIKAPIRRDRVAASGAEWRMGDRLGVELEVGWQVRAPLTVDTIGDRERLRAAVRPVAAIELVDTRMAGASAEVPLAKLADAQVNAGLVLGTPLEAWDGADFGTVRASMRCGAEVLLDGPAEVPGGSALATLRGFLEIVGGHCGGLVPGQVLITGSLHPLHYLDGAVPVAGEIAGLGTVSIDLR